MEIEWSFYECVNNHVLKNLFSSPQKLLLIEGTKDMCIWTKCNKDKKVLHEMHASTKYNAKK